MRKLICSTALLVGVASFMSSMQAGAQKADHYTPDSLRERARPLMEKATTTNGAAAETLDKYGVDYTMLSVRSQSGTPELHEKFGDFFIIVEGSATLLSGGELDHPTTVSPGELHGDNILHSTTTNLAKGDVVHIPANTPHQLVLPKGGTLAYFVIKVKEKD